MAVEVEWRDYDVIVVGSGGAGSIAARAAAEDGASVLVVSKDPIACSDTKISEGIATVRESGSGDDSEETLSENLRVAGGDLPAQGITDAFASDSKAAYDTIRQHGLRPEIDADRQGPQSLPLPLGGHTRRRSVGHINSGIAFGHANWQAVVGEARIDYLEDAWFLDLAETDDVVSGGLIYDAARGVLVAVRAPSVVMAAGGLSTLFFPKTDTMRGNTGDSYAIAARAGADLVDMEQIQFLPFCLASPPSYEGLLCGEPVMASFLGVLRDNNGKVILDGVYLRTRAECSSAIMRAVEDGRGSPNGGAFLDRTTNKTPPKSGPYFMKFVESVLPSAFRNARQALGKAAANCEIPWEVRPAAHYHMGGIHTDEHCASIGGKDGATSEGVAGLFAAGQAMGGVFGANRLGSTSLTEGAVFGIRSGQAAARHARSKSVADDTVLNGLIERTLARFGQKGGRSATQIKMELQKACWDLIGPVRTAERLDEMDNKLDGWAEELDRVVIPAYGTWNQAFLEYEELRNMLDTARAVAAAARERDGSLGGHVRLDKSEISAFSWPYSTMVRQGDNGEMVARRIERPRTPLRQLISYKLKEAWRKAQVKMLHLMPPEMQDRKLEARYKAIMGASNKAPEVYPGSPDAAIADGKQA